MRTHDLSTGWRLRERRPDRDLDLDLSDPTGWIAATVPGTVQQDLIAAGLLPDPFWETDERHVGWVGERDWIYHCTFHTPDFDEDEVVDLCLDGLDTVATVWLNGVRLLETDDMFIPYRVPIGRVLRRHMNVLVLAFRSPIAAARAAEADHGRFPVWNGDPARVHLRKAQYHFGWDWGPTILAVGPWKGIRLEIHRGRIADLACGISVADDHENATVDTTVTVEHSAPGMTVALELRDPAGAAIASAESPAPDRSGGGDTGVTEVRASFEVGRPRLWWPRGAGEQALHHVVATLMDGSAAVHRVEQRIGIRSVRVIRQPLPDEPGTSFFFEVNGRRMFCGGANWIPADVFLPRVDPVRYRRWVELAADAGMTMLRVWGGGIYEADAFYDACDELGILVWQDFMFACGIYPGDAAFLAKVGVEAEAVVRRLRNHPSIALWCGNNEDYALAAEEGRYAAASDGSEPVLSSPDAAPLDRGDDRFPGRVIYERVLPEICAQLDPSTPYWPGSPYGGSHPNDPTTGDRHTWEVWHGELAPYQDYARYEGRFISEFGMMAVPDPATIATFAPPSQRHPGSETLVWHDKADDGEQRLATYLARSFPDADDLGTWVHTTQLLQAEAVTAALLAWRRRWGVPGRRAVGGALVWQLGDCWPAVSWALVDHLLRPKGAYYAARRALAPVALGMAGPPERPEIWAMNATDARLEAMLELDAWSSEGTRLGGSRRPVGIAADGTTELTTFDAPWAGILAVSARLIVADRVVARAASWPVSFRDLDLPDPGISVTRRRGGRLEVSAERPAKGVWFDAGDDVSWSDRLIDVFPGDPHIIEAHGRLRPIALRWLGGSA